MDQSYIKGLGSQLTTSNRFMKQEYTTDIPEALDELPDNNIHTQTFLESPKNIVNKVTSPDIGMDYSLNPYQGCEHGCIYCYARVTHEFWGYSAGLDFETKIIVKKNAPALLEKFLLQKSWRPKPIVLSGNTDCYQPLERKLKVTRSLLEVFYKFRHPVGIITKNALLLRDLDILVPLAKENLVSVMISITTLDEQLRGIMEPRTARAQKKLDAIRILTENGIPVGIMNAPIIPGLNHSEIPKVIEAASKHGALTAGYTIVRLNGAISKLFEDWLQKNFPDRFNKVWNQICDAHDGNVSDSEFGRRIKGSGNIADAISQLFKVSKKKYMGDRQMPQLDTTKFRRGGNYQLF